jgi:hypothetical protein
MCRVWKESVDSRASFIAAVVSPAQRKKEDGSQRKEDGNQCAALRKMCAFARLVLAIQKFVSIRSAVIEVLENKPQDAQQRLAAKVVPLLW